MFPAVLLSKSKHCKWNFSFSFLFLSSPCSVKLVQSSTAQHSSDLQRLDSTYSGPLWYFTNIWLYCHFFLYADIIHKLYIYILYTYKTLLCIKAEFYPNIPEINSYINEQTLNMSRYKMPTRHSSSKTSGWHIHMQTIGLIFIHCTKHTTHTQRQKHLGIQGKPMILVPIQVNITRQHQHWIIQSLEAIRGKNVVNLYAQIRKFRVQIVYKVYVFPTYSAQPLQ